MSQCDHCANRGWGFRLGFARRCEVCCRLPDDAAARQLVERELAGFVLRERPSPHVPPDTGAMRCPWCNHLPSNEDIDTFWMLCEATCFARACIGCVETDNGLQVLMGEDVVDEDTCDDLRLFCPNPTCGKTFAPPEELHFRFCSAEALAAR